MSVTHLVFSSCVGESALGSDRIKSLLNYCYYCSKRN